MNTRWMRLLLPVLLPVLVLWPAGGGAAHTGHSSMNVSCPDPSPNTAGANATHQWCWDMNDFGSTTSDSPTQVEIHLPLGTQLNEDGTHDGADPSDGEKVGQMTVATDHSFDGCGDANDGGTYSVYWEDNWRAYTAPAGWTKVAEYNTVFTVLFFFTENVPIHAIQNNTTGQYALVIDWPEARACAGASTSVCLTLYGYAQNNSSQEWVIRSPSTSGNHTVKTVAIEAGGTTHDDTDTITIS